MERTSLPYAHPRSKGGIDVTFTIASDGHNTIADNIRIDGAMARKLNLPENPLLGKNSHGEASFYEYSANGIEKIFYENTPTIQKIIGAITKKLEEAMTVS